ncbi:hypothetical protein GCM10027403_11910 [Arthrobacter tecti]
MPGQRPRVGLPGPVFAAGGMVKRRYREHPLRTIITTGDAMHVYCKHAYQPANKGVARNYFAYHPIGFAYQIRSIVTRNPVT